MRSNREKQRFCRSSEQQMQRLTHISESPENSAGVLVGWACVFLCSGRHRSGYRFRLTHATGPTAQLYGKKRVEKQKNGVWLSQVEKDAFMSAR